MHPTLTTSEDGAGIAVPRLLPDWAAQASLSLPPPVHQAEALDAIALPEALVRAVPRRQQQFRAGRYCAQQALRALGAAADVPRDHDGAPVWPAGLTGSITHTDDLAVAAVARVRDVGALGIDAERLMTAARAVRVAPAVAMPEEMAELRRAGLGWLEALTVVFSAKEATFKCLHPLVGRLFGFDTVRVERVDAGARRFTVRVVTPLGEAVPAGTRLSGRFAVGGTHVHTAVVLEAAAW